MCGICGFVNLDGRPAERHIVERMSRALVHRGPDEDGVMVQGAAAVAIRRLSIIDLEHGTQPISNEDRSAWVVFNGEIYNSPSLRGELISAGHRFVGHSDTEVIVHQYEEDGTACCARLGGMFAFAVLDLRSMRPGSAPRLLLARDRIGIKPLFYYLDARVLVFSSELTSLVQHDSVPRELNTEVLRQYLSAGAVAAPATMFRAVRQLLPGHHLALRDGKVTLERYWAPELNGERRIGFAHDSPLELRGLLSQAVRDHLLSDVRVGAFLSGGIDSSTVVGLMAEACGAGVPTFSIRFEDQEYDESGFARAVARRFSTDHHEFTVRNEGFRADLLQAVVTHHGQPTADSSAIPTFIVSRLARDSVKVALSGDGGDECFAGYSHYGWVRMIQRLQAWPGSVRSVSQGALKIVGSVPGLQQSDGIRQAANALEVSHAKPWFLPFEVLRINGEEALGQLLTQDAVTAGPSMGEDLSAWLIANRSADPIAQAQRFSFRYYLPDAYLAKVDRMSMANALEVRVPLLDHRVVEFALSFPGTVHWRGGQGKQLLRQAVADLLPADVLAHRKQGFSIPMHRWATREYFALAEDILSEESVRRRGILQPVTVRNLLDRCQGRRMHLRSRESDSRLSHRLFALVVLEMWCRLYLDRLVERPSETARWDSALDVTTRA